MSQIGQDKIYKMVTDKVLEGIEKAISDGGKLPWQKPWNCLMPQNMVTKKAYRGINVWLLSFLPYSSPFYLSYKQVKAKGGNIKKGEEGNVVIFWKWIKVIDKDTNEEKKIPFLRYYKVWNIEQTEGIKAPKIETIDFQPIEEAQKIIDNMPNRPKIENGMKACYYPAFDSVHMPARNTFHNEESYYSVLYHELAHSTGHASRLNRDGVTNFDMFGSHQYSKEELVAEMSATFLCATCGIQPDFDNSVAYLHGWLTKLKSDPKLLIKAGGEAQKACDYILDIQFKPQNEKEENVKEKEEETSALVLVN